MGVLKNTGAVFISGGMSGIGKALACEYMKRGHDVAIFNRSLNPVVVRELEGRVSSTGVRVLFYKTDVTNSEDLFSSMNEASNELGPPQISINSAGTQNAKPFLDISSEDFDRVISVNLIGTRNFAHASARLMKPGAQIVLISSMAGILPNYTYSAYCASKFGAYGLAKVLKVELDRLGIGVCVVCPPEVKTPMIEEEKKTAHPASILMKSFAGSLSADYVSSYVASKIKKRKFLIIPGVRAKLIYCLDKVVPTSILFLFVGAVVSYAFKKIESDKVKL